MRHKPNPPPQAKNASTVNNLKLQTGSKKVFEDLSMEEFLAGEDGDDDESCEVDDVYTVPT